MYTKLTLNIDQEIVESAKTYAKTTNRSVSKLVEEYLSSISMKNTISNRPLEPITKEIAGIIKTKKNINYKKILTEALEEKYL
jgi:hypothetical protein